MTASRRRAQFAQTPTNRVYTTRLLNKQQTMPLSAPLQLRSSRRLMTVSTILPCNMGAMEYTIANVWRATSTHLGGVRIGRWCSSTQRYRAASTENICGCNASTARGRGVVHPRAPGMGDSRQLPRRTFVFLQSQPQQSIEVLQTNTKTRGYSI